MNGRNLDLPEESRGGCWPGPGWKRSSRPASARIATNASRIGGSGKTGRQAGIAWLNG